VLNSTPYDVVRSSDRRLPVSAATNSFYAAFRSYDFSNRPSRSFQRTSDSFGNANVFGGNSPTSSSFSRPWCGRSFKYNATTD